VLPRQALFSADEVALVTGGASGIGRATARALAVAGARVVIVDTDAHAGAETVRSIHSAGGDARQFVADVSCATDVERVMSDVIATCGRLDVACNCAGIVRGPGLLVDVTEGDWNANLTVNLTGVWLCMKYEIPALQLGGRGAIVNVASVAGLRASPRHVGYTVTVGLPS
jgi:NAD(P)-dependent dehydrogenase (short-subunit alcohol dehydrogenase family)